MSLPVLTLIDASGFIFRAYHAIQHLSTSKGVPTNAVYGFTRMILKTLREFAPTHVALEVSDSGTGMDEETRKRCFEPFFSTKGQRGTGLGLAMVYGVMQRHDGVIEIESEPSKGATFRLVFPVREAPRTDALEILAAADPLPPLRILFVDDEPL